MPEGLEALGAENIRDILAFICGDAQKQFRILHLADAYTADSREGVFASEKPNGGQVRLAKFGNVTVEGIPFFIQDAAKSATGSNMIVLKGGPQRRPQPELPRQSRSAGQRGHQAPATTQRHLRLGFPGRPRRSARTASHGGVCQRREGDLRTQERCGVRRLHPSGRSARLAIRRRHHRRPADAPAHSQAHEDRRGEDSCAGKSRRQSHACRWSWPSPPTSKARWMPRAMKRPRQGAASKNVAAPSVGPKEGGKGDGPARAGQTGGLGIRQNQGPRHRRRFLAQLPEILRRVRQRHPQGRGLLRALHRRSRPGRGGTKERRRGRHQREPEVLRHPRLSQGADGLCRQRQRYGHAPSRHLVWIRPMAGIERENRRRRRPRARCHRQVHGVRLEEGSSGHERRAGKLRQSRTNSTT